MSQQPVQERIGPIRTFEDKRKAPEYVGIAIPGKPCPELFAAIRKNEVKTVENILADSTHASSYSNPYTALTLASLYGNKDIVGLLIAHKAEVNCANHWGDSPLLIAATNGHLSVVEVLIAAKAEVNYRNGLREYPEMFTSIVLPRQVLPTGDYVTTSIRGNTPLSMAAERGHLGIVFALLKKGRAKPNMKDDQNNSALHLALKAEQRERNPQQKSVYVQIQWLLLEAQLIWASRPAEYGGLDPRRPAELLTASEDMDRQKMRLTMGEISSQEVFLIKNEASLAPLMEETQTLDPFSPSFSAAFSSIGASPALGSLVSPYSLTSRSSLGASTSPPPFSSASSSALGSPSNDLGGSSSSSSSSSLGNPVSPLSSAQAVDPGALSLSSSSSSKDPVTPQSMGSFVSGLSLTSSSTARTPFFDPRSFFPASCSSSSSYNPLSQSDSNKAKKRAREDDAQLESASASTKKSNSASSISASMATLLGSTLAFLTPPSAQDMGGAQACRKTLRSLIIQKYPQLKGFINLVGNPTPARIMLQIDSSSSKDELTAIFSRLGATIADKSSAKYQVILTKSKCENAIEHFMGLLRPALPASSLAPAMS